MDLAGQTILHYRVVDKIGEGGMGEVYRAEDTKLQRTVALKFLSSRLVRNDVDRERFLQEARAAAALDHPNICTVYEVGEVHGRPYLAMAYIEGQSLDRKISGSPLNLEEAVDLAMQIGEGLEAAHQKGIVHRDIKSANITVTPAGQAKIMDFGVAQRTSAAGRSVQELVGTAAYMSPEQATGEAVDERTDIWSLGVVLYEMVSGCVPFGGEYEAAVLYSVLHEEPQRLTKLNPNVPSLFEKVVRKAVRKDRDTRYQQVSEILEDLRSVREQLRLRPSTRSSRRLMAAVALAPARIKAWYWVAFALLLFAAGGMVWHFAQSGDTGGRTVRTLPAKPSVAVLPLANLSDQPGQDFFADGMTEALITTLARIKALRVISRTSAMQYAEREAPLTEIAAALNVDYVVEGSVLRDGDRVRISAQLIDARGDRSLWADQYDGSLKDVLSLQSEVAKAIAGEIQVKLTPRDEGVLASLGNVSPEAYEKYLLGRYFSKQRSKEDLENALEAFQSVIQSEPDWAPAYAGLADTYILMANYGLVPPTEVWPKAKQAAERALELDRTLAEAHSSLALIKSFYEWDWAGAAEEFEHAMELGSGNATERHRYAVYLSRMGRHREAIREIEQAQQLDPLSLSVNNAAAVLYYMARQYDKALRQLQSNLELSDTYYRTYWNVGRCYLEQGRFAQAIEALQKAKDLSGNNPYLAAALAHGYARAGDRRQARQILNELQQLSRSRYVSPASLALIEIGLRNIDRAFTQLDRALLERSGSLVWLKVDPAYEPLRGDPRYRRMLSETGLDG